MKASLVIAFSLPPRSPPANVIMTHCVQKLVSDSLLIKMNGFKKVLLFLKVIVWLLLQQKFGNTCGKCLMNLKFRVYEHAMSCIIEINSNSGNEWAREILLFNHQKTFHLHCHYVYRHQDWQSDSLPWETLTHKGTWPFELMVFRYNVTKWNHYISTTTQYLLLPNLAGWWFTWRSFYE